MPLREITTHCAAGLNDQIRVFSLDEPGSGGACHDYVMLTPMLDGAAILVARAGFRELPAPQHFDISPSLRLEVQAFRGGHLARIVTVAKPSPPDEESTYEMRDGEITVAHYFNVQRIRFQTGLINEAGANGTSHEALLAIILDRLEGFQRGDFKCRDNAVAATHIETGLLWLKKRTWDRVARGVEGMLKP